jgi:pimeloyl-ACP methyl ester carboxylesterase
LRIRNSQVKGKSLPATPARQPIPPDPEPNTSRTIEVLTSIWERLLQRAPIAPDEKFVDLGGDPPLAFKLFTQIADAFGRELPPTTIYQAPTISALAKLLDSPAPPPFSPLVLLNSGSEVPPVFIAHGAGSHVLEFFGLMKHMRTARAIYGLQSKGSDGSDHPLASVKDMALFHVRAIQSIQPRGPYTLIGYSLGGVVALEMARLLSARGEKIALLVMVDAYPCVRKITPWTRAHMEFNQAKYRLSDAFWALRDPAHRTPLVDVRERGDFSSLLAWIRHRPGIYAGKVKFLRAENSDYPDPVPLWRPFIADFQVETTPGDHHGCLLTYYESLASLLLRYLNASS